MFNKAILENGGILKSVPHLCKARAYSRKIIFGGGR